MNAQTAIVDDKNDKTLDNNSTKNLSVTDEVIACGDEARQDEKCDDNKSVFLPTPFFLPNFFDSFEGFVKMLLQSAVFDATCHICTLQCLRFSAKK